VLPGVVIRGGHFFLYYKIEALGLCFLTSYALMGIEFEIKTNFGKTGLADDFSRIKIWHAKRRSSHLFPRSFFCAKTKKKVVG
jgi:hypothetical protein